MAAKTTFRLQHRQDVNHVYSGEQDVNHVYFGEQDVNHVYFRELSLILMCLSMSYTSLLI